MGLRVEETSNGFLNIIWPAEKAPEPDFRINALSEQLEAQQPPSNPLAPERVSPTQSKTSKLISSCAFLPLLVFGVLETTAHWAEPEEEEKISSIKNKRNLFYGSIPFIVYGATASSSFGLPILLGGTAIALKNLKGLYNDAKVFQARWIG